MSRVIVGRTQQFLPTMYLPDFTRLTVKSPGLLSVVWLIFQIWLQYGADGCKFRSIPSIPKIKYSQSGTLNIGIIMSVHEYEPGTKCGTVLRPLGVLQRMESMVFAINEINTKKMVQHNVTLGFTIVDDCSNSITALDKTLDILDCLNTYSEGEQDKVVAVIGADSSEISLKIAYFLKLAEVPQLSFGATYPILDNKNIFSYFFRTAPSDVMQAQAIAAILKQFHWSYVSMVYNDDYYGDMLYQGVKEQLRKLGYCFAVLQKISKQFNETDYKKVAEKLSEEPLAHVVIVVLTLSEAKVMFKTFTKNWRNNFTWIVAESVGARVQVLSFAKDAISGMLALKLHSSPVERFNEFFKYLTIRNGSRNPWLRKYFEQAFGCDVNGINSCNWDTPIKNSPNYEPESSVALSMDAVYVFAHALKITLDNCSDTTSFHQCLGNKKLRDAMRKVNFEGEQVHISFNENGSALASYEINNVFFKDGRLVINTVGVWNSSTRNFSFFHSDNVTWNWERNTLSSRNRHKRKAPASTCSNSCPAGFQQIITSKCCWNCTLCKKNERTVFADSVQICSVCPNSDNFTWPDKPTRTKCLPIQPTFSILSQKFGVFGFALNILVLFSALTISTLYVINHNNQLIKASSREISQMMLVGHAIVCLLAISYFLKPIELTCALFQIWFPLSFSITYGPLLVKTNRIYRIFFMKKITTKQPRFTSPKAQVVMVTVIIVIQILLSAMGLVLKPSNVDLFMPSFHTKYVEEVCAPNITGMVLSLSYAMCLAIGCSCYTYRVRNLPSHFNEAKFIVMSIYCIALLWIGFIIGYFTSSSEIVKKCWIVVFMILNMFVAQVFLFYPKLFVIYCFHVKLRVRVFPLLKSSSTKESRVLTII